MKKTTKGIIAIGVSLAILGFILIKVKKSKGKGGSSVIPNNEGDVILNFKSLANDLFECFDNYGTSWDDGPSGGIIGIMDRLETNEDFDSLKLAYGIRKINCGSFNPFCTDFEGDMIGALKDELDESELNEINDLLKRKGINRSI